MKSASILLRAMFVALMVTVGLSQLQAQIQITVGTATLASTGTDMKSPYSRWYTSEHKQYLVTAAELNAAGAVPGDIKGLAFNVSSAAGAGGTCKGWTMKMKLTTATNVATPFDISGFTQVVDPIDMNVTTTGWYQHDFGTTIFWDGTSNIMVDVCYNNYFGGADYNTAGANVWCSIPTGVTTAMYVGYTDGANYCGSTVASLSSNYRPQMRFEFRPVGVKNTFPKGSRIVGMPDSSLLRSNAIYNGSNSEAPAASRPGVTFGSIPGFTTTFTYTITGPLPSNNIVYRGMDAAGQTTMTAPAGGGNMFIPNADGILANPSAPTAQNGTGFLNTAVPPNQGGTYRLTVVATTSKGTSSFVQTVVNDFVVAVDRDMTAVGLSRPLGKNQQVYFKTNNIPITAQFKNVGVQPVMSYKGICDIRNATTGVLVRHDEVIRSTSSGIPPTGIVTGAIDEFDFPSFTSIQADSFSISICTEMIDPIPDQQAFNDCYPLAGAAPFTFIVKNLIDYETVNITSPSSGIYAGRPSTPSAQIANNGAFADPIPVFLNITLLPNTPIVTNQMMLVEVPNGIFNKSVVSFPPFTPPAGGQYQICIKAAQQGDEVPANDEKCVTITVIDRLIGDFTVGSNTKPGVPGFPTIQAAVDALYQRGVRGNVRFLLTDPFYSVGNTANIGTPALDLSSNIIGVGPNSTVTWMADPQSTGLSKAGVTIQLNSSNGIGVLLGQNAQPANFNAVQLEFPNRDNANSPGYMNFDGGAQKSLKFQLRTFANRRAVFYVGRRSYNNTIQNSIIELDPSTPELDFWHTLPGVTIESNAFKFGADSAGFGANFSTFTAGIFQRNTPPANEFGNNREGLDTSVTINNVTYLGNKANKFIGNEIRGFGYGIASIGIGTLKKNNKLTRYYNSGTEIRDNMISKVRRAGIFLGYEDGAMVTGNKIFDVGLSATGKTGEANGIEVGGQQNSLTHIGFNNINCEIGRNEINGVTSDVFARGVKVQQSLNDLSSVVPPPGDYLQPSVPENMNIHGNMIWGLSRTNAGASRAGIHVFTDRNGSAGINGVITARISNYFTRNDQIANNTIMMANDNISNSGGVVGIGVQHGKSTTLMNNAIAMTGTNTTADIAGGYPHAALFYQGLHPKYVGGLTADRNAYWSPNAATVRFYEIDSISQTLLAGYQDEYQTLAQWRAWTKQDLNSLIGNWTGDYVTSGVAPIQYVRIRTNPAPTGSILNNRGARIANVTSDVDGQARGSAGQAYDIGADEFNGVSYVNDVEVTTILAPRSYRTGASQVNFADAEHLMVDANVKVVARLRNNGSISQVVNVVGEYAVENASSSGNSLPSYPGFSGLSNVTVQIAAGESKDVDLGVLTPQSLSQLSGYTTPIWMQKQVDSSMRVNVTPRYKIQARVTTPDENFSNNSDAMDARFYIRRSNIKMMTSWVGKSYAHTNPLNVTTDPLYARNTIARLNADSLKRGLDAMGFWSGLRTGIAIPDINYDIMDRDGWEPRSVDYTWYKTLVWSEDNTGMSRFERDNIRDFVAASNVVNTKKNFVIGSQEIVKTHVGMNAVNDEYFPRYTLRSQRGKSTAAVPAVVTTPVAAGYAMPPIVAPFRSDVIGMTIEKNITENIKGTGFVNGTWSDPLPLPALMSVYVDGFTQGLARPAFKYTTKDANVADSAMGITVTGAGTNVVHLGVDWRHYGKTTQSNGIERVLRGTLDFFDVNDGTVVPVELADFDAKAAGKSVNVFWSTASESNSGWFEVERKQAGREFANIATVPAAGTSTSILNYGIKDENVENGTTYTYRLKNVDRDGKTGYSYEVEVVIGGESTSLSLGNATPSPINNESTVSYSMSVGGEVALNLYDMMGRLVQTVDNGNRAAGAHAATINSNGLSSGMYQLVLKVGSETTTRLVQIVK